MIHMHRVFVVDQWKTQELKSGRFVLDFDSLEVGLVSNCLKLT